MATTAKNSRSSNATDNDIKIHSQELGWFGSVFGSRDHAPIYISGVLALLALAGAIAVSLISSYSEQADTIKGLLAIVVASLSFMGGASGKIEK